MINKPKNWDEIEETEVVGSDSLPIGPYPVQIKRVTDVPEKEYLKIEFEIVKGKYANYFTGLKDRMQLDVWPNQATYYASYKETATKFFKAFITAVQKSNQGYVWNWDASSLVGKYMVAVYGEEEYEYEGEIRVAVKVREIRSAEALKNGDIKIPELKKLRKQETKTTNTFVEMLKDINDNDLNDPF